MRKEGAANKGILVVMVVVLIVAVVTVVMIARGGDVTPQPEPEPAPAPKPVPITPVAQPPEPAPAPPEPVAVVDEPQAEPEAQPEPEPSVEVAKADEPKEPLNARTLAGSKWKPALTESMKNSNFKIEIEFAPDGTWRVNNNIRAKWKVEGNRVKIFDDKGEVHYVDIVGDKLMFNGEEIQRAD